MKKINLFDETIVISNSELSQALDSSKKFGITIKGEIKFTPFETRDIFVYQSDTSLETPSTSSTSKSKELQELLGEKYYIHEEGDRVLINAGEAWQKIIDYNLHNAHYDDTMGGGIVEFKDEALEEMGWMIIDFDVSYRELLDLLEESLDLTLICIEQKEPYRFSSMGYFNDLERARKLMFEFCQGVIKDKLNNDPDFSEALLDEDQIEAKEFFLNQSL